MACLEQGLKEVPDHDPANTALKRAMAVAIEFLVTTLTPF